MNPKNEKIRAFLNSRWWIVTMGALVVISHSLFAIQALQGDTFIIAIMIFFLFFWTFYAIGAQYHWGKTLKDWGRTISLFKESNALLSDCESLLNEALDGLSTYDRDKANDIADRGSTIIRMRINRMREITNDGDR